MGSAGRIAHRLASVTFLAALVVALVGGLLWALNPDTSTGFTITEGGVEPPDAEAGAVPEAEAAEPTPNPEPTPTPSPTPTEDPEELIAAAREPDATTVQVLEAGGSMEATTAAADTLDELGYDIVSVTSARVDVTQTTVWFTDGNEDEALALRAREPRVVLVEPNQGLHDNIDLHLLVGPDWES